ncbi:MAG: polysaccharide biosynthesis tyrosine autokinase [Flavobacteriales bacterium]|nr:polysaccharide biosynthesis tyrosine autokinase [Flavobacteriales bacterium]
MRQEEISSFNESFERYRDRITNFSNEFEFGLFLHIFRVSLPIVISLFIIFGVGAWLYLRYTIPVYKSTTTLQLEKSDQAEKILNVSGYQDANNLSSDIELLRSRFMIYRTLEGLNLPVRYFEQGTVRGSEHYKSSGYEVKTLAINDSTQILNSPFFIDFSNSGSFNITFKNQEYGPYRTAEQIDLGYIEFVILVTNESISTDLSLGNRKYFVIPSREALASEFIKQINVGVLNPTAKTLLLSCENNNARLATDLIMAHAQAFLKYDQSRKEKSSERVIEFIDSQLDTVSENLRNAEFLLNSFKQEYKINDLNMVSDVYLDRLNTVEQQLFDLKIADNLLNEISKIQDSASDMDVYNLMAVIAGSEYENTLQGLLDELGELLKSREEIFYEITAESDFTKSLDYRIEIQKNLILESISSLKKKNTERRKLLEVRNEELESVFRGLPTKELEYARYERLYSINEKYYTSLLEKRIEYRISKAGFVSDNKVLEAASVPSLPISPNAKMIYTSFLGIGLLLSFLFVIVRYLLHNNITSLNEIAKLSHASIGILGIIPKYKEQIPVSQLLINKKPKSLLAESFRTIRTNLQFVDNESGSKVVAVTSTISSEGKTFIAINLAGILAFSGKRVLLLDLDMRKPKIHKGFGVDNERGMSTLLIHKHSLEQCVRKSDEKNLDFITAGPIPPNPSELIISPAMSDILAEVKTMYDIIVIDNPPVGLVTDGISTIQLADYPIYIFRADYSKKHFVQNVDRLINENGIKKLSVILNGVDVERNRYGSYYGYGYGYAYGSGYGYGYYGTSKEPKKSFWQKLKPSSWKRKKQGYKGSSR